MMGMKYSGLFALIVLFLDIWAIVKLLQCNASAGIKALWIVAIVFLPVLGLILWFLFGPKN